MRRSEHSCHLDRLRRFGRVSFIVGSFLVGISSLALLMAVVGIKKPPKIREFFKLGSVDWPGLGVIAALTLVLNILERRFLFEPVRRFLISISMWGGPSRQVGCQPPHNFVELNLALLILVLWSEAPEEVFFRGYVQNCL